MPRVAILSDIHGNVPALEAVLADVERQKPDEILIGGDLVGRGPQGSRVVAIIREGGWRTIRGNHEDYLLAFRKGDIPDEWRELEVWAASRWMAAELAEEDISYLESLPADVRPHCLPQVRLVHGTPRSNNEGIGPWTSDRSMCRHLDSIRESVLICAHTHRPLDRRFPEGRVINVGSVGLPFNRDPRAQYVVLHAAGDDLEPEFRRVDYDRDEILRIYRDSGFLDAGGATARLLEMEVREAAPFLVPFLYWTEAEGLPQANAAIADFLEAYDPDRQREFFDALARESRPAPAAE